MRGQQRGRAIAMTGDERDDFLRLRGVEPAGSVEVVGEAPRTGEPSDVPAVPERLFADKHMGGAATSGTAAGTAGCASLRRRS